MCTDRDTNKKIVIAIDGFSSCGKSTFAKAIASGYPFGAVVGRRDVVNRMMSNIRQNLRYSGLAALLAQALPPEQENL